MLRIIDAQDAMKDILSRGSFACGFKMGLTLSEELRQYRDICSRFQRRCID